MKNMILFASLLLGMLIVSTPKPSSAQTDKGIYIKAHFKKTGSFILSYYGQNYRLTSVVMKNNNNSDTVIVKSIDVNQPTVFQARAISRNGLMIYKFIGYNQKDTISLDVKDTVFSMANMTVSYAIPIYVGQDKIKKFFDENFGVSDLSSEKSYSIDEYKNKKYAADNDRDDQLKRLNGLVKENKIDERSIQILKNYIDLNYYSRLLSVSYGKATEAGWKHPDMAKFDSIEDRNHLLLSVSSPEARTILFDVISYNNYLNKSQNKTYFDNILSLPSRYTKTKLLDGLIMDELPNRTKTLDERRQALEKLTPVMLDNKEDKIALAKLGVITREVSNVKLKSYDGITTSFDQLLKGDRKIIVLDFWASWCVPCVAEIPRLHEAGKKLSSKIKFVSLSIDKNSAKWLEGCDKHDVKENSYLLSDLSNNALVKCIGFSTIPTFAVLTNKGEVLSLSFLRPSNPEFVVELQKMLEAL